MLEIEMSSEPTPHDSDREQRAMKIVANPTAFKVCEGCGSVVSRSTAMCSNCNAYRFDASVSGVTKQARYLASRQRQSVIAEDLD